jgi:hypothetical protein
MTVQSMNPAGGPGPARARSRLRLCRTRTARCDADFLDGLVDAELELVRRLPTHLRVRPVEMLAVLAMLAQDYRHYAWGWINRRELRHCAQRAVHNLDAMRCQLTALDLTR